MFTSGLSIDWRHHGSIRHGVDEVNPHFRVVLFAYGFCGAGSSNNNHLTCATTHTHSLCSGQALTLALQGKGIITRRKAIALHLLELLP